MIWGFFFNYIIPGKTIGSIIAKLIIDQVLLLQTTFQMQFHSKLMFVVYLVSYCQHSVLLYHFCFRSKKLEQQSIYR